MIAVMFSVSRNTLLTRALKLTHDGLKTDVTLHDSSCRLAAGSFSPTFQRYIFFSTGVQMIAYFKQMNTNAENQDALKCHRRFSAWNPLSSVELY